MSEFDLLETVGILYLMLVFLVQPPSPTLAVAFSLKLADLPELALPWILFSVLTSEWPVFFQCFGSAKVFMRIRIQDPKKVHVDPDPDPDPNYFILIQKGVKIKEDNLYKQIFNYIFQNDIKSPLTICKHELLQKDHYFYVSSSVLP